MGGDPGYVYKKDAVTISEVHTASLAAASPPLHHRITAAPSADVLPPCGQQYQIWNDAPTVVIPH